MKINRILAAFMFFLISSYSGWAQLGFCTGSKGDPIFHEDFGSGSGTGPALATGITTYKYIVGDPQDGQYTISSTIGRQITSWHSFFPQTTLSNGRALIVNADFNAGKFFETKINGLCENTTYEFSAYLMNVYNRASGNCENGGIPINVRFEIWDETNTTLLKKGSTGDIASTSTPVWKQYALTFQSEPSQGAVILKMYNNGAGGCGNDLAIDDILFRSCGDLTTINSSTTTGTRVDICAENAPVGFTLTATPDNSVYKQHAYQWQESLDGEIWQDIPGATTDTYATPQLNSTHYYRVKVAEDKVNLSNNLCSSASDPFVVNIVEKPNAPQSNGDIVVCENDPFPPLSVNAEIDETISWYSQSTGGSILATGTTFYPGSAGTYYAEAVKTGYSCSPSSRTPVKFQIDPAPMARDEEKTLCPNAEITLDTGIPNMKYIWSTGQTSQQITINNSGQYSVKITNSSGCSAIKNFTVVLADDAEISRIISEGEKVIITPVYQGAFEYSLDGINFQASNIFNPIPGGIYTAYMRDKGGCKTVSKVFPHIVVPKFITPNNDGYNDVFTLKGSGYYEFSEVIIFDRYGKILKRGSGNTFSWDGKLNGKALPSDDYWYSININGNITKGHFTLKR